jgi:hypothetical protein
MPRFLTRTLLLVLPLALAGCDSARSTGADTFPVEIVSVTPRGPVTSAQAADPLNLVQLDFAVRTSVSAEPIIVDVTLLRGATVVDQAGAPLTSLRAGETGVAAAVFGQVRSHADYTCYRYSITVQPVSGRVQTRDFSAVCRS